MRRKNVWLTGVVLSMTGWMGAACSGRTEAQSSKVASATAKPISVSVAEARLERVDKRIEITGTLGPWQEAVLSVEVEGRIEQVLVDLGDRVQEGASLMRIAPQEYDLRLTQAEVELSAARAEKERMEKLVKDNLVSQQQLDESRRRLDLAQATVELARKKKNDTLLRAPFPGMVAKRMVNRGEYVRAGTAAFQVVRLSPLKFRGEAPERFTLDVKPGDPVTVTPDALRGQSLTGKIVRVSPSVTQETRSFGIEAEIQNPGEQVKPGSFARLTIQTKTPQDVLTVPESSLMSFAGNPRVFVVQNGKAFERVVELGEKLKERVIVLKGIAAGEKVATSAVELLSDQRDVTAR